MSATGALTYITNRNEASYLLKLPAEVLCQVYLNLSSIDAVCALMCTCSKLWNVFYVRPVQIVENVLTNSMPNQMAGVIQAVWNLYSGRPRFMTLRVMRGIDEAHCLSSLNKHVSAEFIWKFISLARRIHVTAHFILDDCLTNLVNIRDKLHPYPMLFPEIDRPGQHRRPRWIDPRPFLTSPSWCEEWRMIQGLWLCEFHASLMEAQRHAHAWICAELAHAARLGLEDFFDNGWAGTFWTIHHGLGALSSSRSQFRNSHDREVMLPDEMSLRASPWPAGVTTAQSCRWTFSAPPVVGQGVPWDQTILDPETEGYMFLIADDTGIAPRAAELYRLPASEYAHLGLLHWCRERMHDLGLVYRNDCRIHDMWHGRVYDYWLSLLPRWLIQRWEEIQREEKREQRRRHGRR
ncbi:hypothetical protein A9K55_007598 [Cordyceps militaris]|uniref:F-box domain-containing protein n=1 Tax=Cordyceps militaris TaxID=73501 RepID=A0A2H4SIZ9_CORMI|nr:hypothetical protein A9K55_007598 [Cordyceps militaris]